MIETIIKNNFDGINTAIALTDLWEIVANTPLFPINPPLLFENNQLGILFGKPVYSINGGAIVFCKCKYCHTEEPPKLSGNYFVCSQCGAYIE